MINSVNSTPMIQAVTQNGNKKVMTAPQPVQVNNAPNVDMKGTEALASYNKSMVAVNEPKVLEPAIPTILQPEVIHSMPGERIYSSSGNLDSIGVNDGKLTTIYSMDVMAPNDAISKIETYDNATGKLVKIQRNYNLIEDGKMPQNFYTEISELNSDGKIVKSTIYSGGKLDCVRAFEYGPNNYSKIYNVSEEGASVEEDFGDKTFKMTRFDKNGQISSVETHDIENEKIEKIQYQNGFPSKIVNETQSPIPNTTGKNPQNDPDLIPFEPYVLGYDPKEVQGEKRNYSNGSLEAIFTQTANGEITHFFNLDGTLRTIFDDTNNRKRDITFERDFGGNVSSYKISERFSDDIVKHTRYFEDGSYDVEVADDKNKTSKYASYTKEGRLGSYVERSGDESMIMIFNKKGELVSLKHRND